MRWVGTRVVGLLLAWMALGFAFDAATAEFQHDVLVDALEPGDRDQVVPPTLLSRGATASLALFVLVLGLTLMGRPTGEGHVPEWKPGDRVEADHRMQRCYRCRKRWPQGAPTCPKCGAERLS